MMISQYYTEDWRVT